MEVKEYHLLILVIALIISNVFWAFTYINSNSNDENYLLKSIMQADYELAKISVVSQRAVSYYNEASLYYEAGQYNLVESNCKLARDYYLEENQGYKRVKAELEAKELKDELINIYMEGLDLLSDISINMYEACEHFEAVARYFNTYFNTDVKYNNFSYDMGVSAIENMNEKIRAHDSNINEYNDVLQKYRVELEGRLEDE